MDALAGVAERGVGGLALAGAETAQRDGEVVDAKLTHDRFLLQ
ncbi:hypothetical protein [Nonomuraea deserti]|nr:hypothetical protein [Nonomuraea deserti]